MAKRMVLLIKAKEMRANTTAKASSTRLIFRILSFTKSINSDSIAKIEKMIKKNTNIQDVLYQRELA